MRDAYKVRMQMFLIEQSLIEKYGPEKYCEIKEKINKIANDIIAYQLNKYFIDNHLNYIYDDYLDYPEALTNLFLKLQKEKLYDEIDKMVAITCAALSKILFIKF